MKKNRLLMTAKILALLAVLLLFSFTGKNIYQSIRRVKKVNEGMVKSLRLQLDLESIKKAAGMLKKSS